MRQVGGAITAVAADPRRRVAWVALGPRVLAMAVDHDGLLPIGRTAALPGLVSAIEVTEDHVLAIDAASEHGLWWIDGRVPAAELKAHPIDVGAKVRAVAVHGDEAVLVAGDELVYLRLHEGESPRVIQRYRVKGVDNDRRAPVRALALSSTHVAYVFGSDRTVLRRRWMGAGETDGGVRFASYGDVQHLRFSDSHLYLLRSEALEMWSLDPPTQVTAWAGTRFGDPLDVVVTGRQLGLLEYVVGEGVLRISVHTHGETGRIDALASAREMATVVDKRTALSPMRIARVAGGLVVAPAADRLQYVPDAALVDPERNLPPAWYAAPGPVSALAAGAEIVVADPMHAVTVLEPDVGQTLSLGRRWADERVRWDLASTVSLHRFGGALWRFAPSGGVVLEVGNSGSPRELRRIPVREGTAMAWDDRLMHLCTDGQLLVLDETYALAGTVLARYDAWCADTLYARQGTRLWEGQRAGWLVATEFSGPQRVLGFPPAPVGGQPRALHGLGTYLVVVATDSSGSNDLDDLLVLDVANASSPRVIGLLDLGPSGLRLRHGHAVPVPRMALHGTELAIAHPQIGLLLIDLEVPARPDEIGRISPPGTVTSVAYVNGGWVVGTLLGGLFWVERGAAPRPTRRPIPSATPPRPSAERSSDTRLILPWLRGGGAGSIATAPR